MVDWLSDAHFSLRSTGAIVNCLNDDCGMELNLAVHSWQGGVFRSATTSSQTSPRALGPIFILLSTDYVSDDDKWEGKDCPCYRTWKAYQERGGSEGRWMRTDISTIQPNGSASVAIRSTRAAWFELQDSLGHWGKGLSLE